MSFVFLLTPILRYCHVQRGLLNFRRLDALLGKIPGERTIPSDRGNEAGANIRNERSKDSTKKDDGGGPSRNEDKEANRRKRDSVSEELRCMQRFASCELYQVSSNNTLTG